MARTDIPWDPSTLNSDSAPQWAPGPIERLFVLNSFANQVDHYSNLTGLTVSDRIPNADGGRTVISRSEDGFTVIFHERADGIVDKIVTRDPLGNETTEDNWRSNGLLKKYYDTQNSHPYTELDITEDATGKVTAAQLRIDGQPATADFSAVGQVLGSALAPNNQFVQLSAGTVIGAAGQRLSQAFAGSLATEGATVDLSGAFANQCRHRGRPARNGRA
ncbi:hypothetical protein [uncultured Bradyrhizobium sp.]|uniref:hypothetical protein n=1 Tax=uncultured Bradyrhizobium sp. TaxID=199684 RepID=UPI0035CC7E5C